MLSRFNTLPVLMLAATLTLGCGRTNLDEKGGEDGFSSMIFMQDEPAGLNCPDGGIAIHTGLDTNRNGILDFDEITATQYVCDGEDGTSGGDGLTSLLDVADIPPGTTCANGGIQVTQGLDEDEDGRLDPSEVLSTDYICNGTGGSGGPATLLEATDEPPGENCPAGGEFLQWGTDANENGQLDDDEIEHSEYFCNGETGADGHATLFDVQDEPAGANCPTGGQAISWGVDLNDNSELDTLEVVGTEYVCNGLDGEGFNSLVNVIDESPGLNCTFGGQAIQTGLDRNRNGILDPDEIEDINYVCDGADGADGADGLSSLVRLEDEPPGGNCPYGGQAVHSGLDTNDDGYLDDNEVLSTSYVCNGAEGAPGHNSLIETSEVPPGGQCPAGGYLVESGVDMNDNGNLEPNEVQASEYVCHGIDGEQGEQGLSTLVHVTDEPPGGNCPNGGQRIQFGVDDNGNDTLDQPEVDYTDYVCNGAAGVNSLVKFTDEPAGGNCPNGGQRVDSGLDNNRNGNLDPLEITDTAYVCNGGNVLIRVSEAMWGGVCGHGGVVVESGLDDNGNGVLEDGEVDHTQYVCNVYTVQVATGLRHTCSLMSNGTVRCWGKNENGQLGIGNTVDSKVPVQVAGVADATAISTGAWHSCALIAGGTVRCWGFNETGALGDNSTIQRTLPVQVVGLNNALSISAGGGHTCAKVSGNTAVCWGFNDDGQIGDGSTTTRLTPVPVSGLVNLLSISAGGYHTCGLQNNGRIRCWGSNSKGQLGDGTTTPHPTPELVSNLVDATKVDAGASHTCAARSNGTATCWGDNAVGQLGNGSFNPSSVPVTVLGITGVNQISGGAAHTCASLATGTVYCWGYNPGGALGDGTTTVRTTPVQALGISTSTAVDAGGYHSCASLTGGSLRCWGTNDVGQVGDGTQINRLTPVEPIN